MRYFILFFLFICSLCFLISYISCKEIPQYTPEKSPYIINIQDDLKFSNYPIGTVTIHELANVRRFLGYPNTGEGTIVGSKKGQINVYEIFSNNQNCVWLRINHKWNDWIYWDKKFIYQNFSRELLLSDNDFINQNFTYIQTKKFFNSFPNNKLTDGQIRLIYDECKKNRISILVVSAKLEQEGSIVRNDSPLPYNQRLNRCMGAKLTVIKNGKCPYENFESQIKIGINTLRKHYNTSSKYIMLDFGQGLVLPKNNATYSLYKYCPIYDEYDVGNGKLYIGNRIFIKLYFIMDNQWEKVNG